MPNPDPLLQERAARIRLLALDVDGVLTDGKIYFDSSGNELKAFYTPDGLGLKALQQSGIVKRKERFLLHKMMLFQNAHLELCRAIDAAGELILFDRENGDSATSCQRCSRCSWWR